MSVSEALRRQLGACFDLLLPPACQFCGSAALPDPAGHALCAACRASLQPLTAACRRCLQPLQSFDPACHTCEACLRRPPAFSRVSALGRYAGPLKTAIHRLKYRDQLRLANLLGALLGDRLLDDDPGYHCDLLVPVPLHLGRLRQRGYNQALELARPVARRLGCPLAARSLTRTRATVSQQGLGLAERTANLRSAFCCPADLRGRHVLLLDDVMTSGTTARECSRVLIAAGAAEVRVAVIGRA